MSENNRSHYNNHCNGEFIIVKEEENKDNTYHNMATTIIKYTYKCNKCGKSLKE